ncbi:pfkB carbohydrate kinase family protein, partial [Vibrio parahaemolyticus VPTS-2010]
KLQNGRHRYHRC